MRGLGEAITQSEIATAGQTNAQAAADAQSASDLADAWNWLTDPTGVGAGYFPTQDQMAAIENPTQKATSNYLLYGALAIGAYFLFKSM